MYLSFVYIPLGNCLYMLILNFRLMIKKAVIVAGGAGNRLKPLTIDYTKFILDVKGKPLLEHMIENFRKYGIIDITLALGYKAKQIKDYFADGSHLGVNLTYSEESEPLGTGGSIKKAIADYDKPFFLAWGDNLTDIDLEVMYKNFLMEAPQVTMAVTPAENIKDLGVAEVSDNKVTWFVEKPDPENTTSMLVNAGIFIIEPECLKILPEGESSFEKTILEPLAPLGEISAHVHDGQWYPTDTPEKLEHARQNFRPIQNFDNTRFE